jgi:ribosomal protein S18 acetylase RimI-like enzyme
VHSWIDQSITGADAPDQVVLVARKGDHVVGVITVSERRHFAGDVDAYIGELVVSNECEGQGIGQALVKAAEAWAADRGLGHIALETGAANRRARTFYEKSGYLEEDVRLTKRIQCRSPSL